MYLQRYTCEELRFAYQCHVYYRWHTYYRRPIGQLREISKYDLEARHPDIHILDIQATDIEMAVFASVLPTESISTGASKLKGGMSKTLRDRLALSHPEPLLGGGYFACTTGAITSQELDHYLDRQSQHHGYDRQYNPPVWVHTWPSHQANDPALQASHAVTRIRWHLVLTTWNRRGTFTRDAAQAVTACWDSATRQERFRFVKVSWLPDHVHLAIATHPAVVPATLICFLLNESQDVMADRFDWLLLETGNPRLWKPGAFVGTYGRLADRQIQAYLRRWRNENQLRRATT